MRFVDAPAPTRPRPIAAEVALTLHQLEPAAERIRRQVAESRCRCQLAPEFVDEHGRCGRCYGGRP